MKPPDDGCDFVDAGNPDAGNADLRAEGKRKRKEISGSDNAYEMTLHTVPPKFWQPLGIRWTDP